MEASKHQALAVYRLGLRSIKLLDGTGQQSYYRRHLRAQFVAHRGTEEVDRIEELLARARRDIQWVVSQRGGGKKKT
jgi:hypothetical protein